ncbi:MAG TPA: acyl-CoA dehydrogenase family protein [Acidimicrobiales bacterium]|nr:acyl-CoA dehydrogenase family protein [Acidimicrobiales bacterium]
MPVTDPLDAAARLAPLIDAEAAAADAAGTLTEPLVRGLADAGLFGLLVPRALGGMEADAVTTLLVFEELSRADGSTGWSFLANATTTAFAAAYTGDAAVKEMFSGPAPVVHAGMLGPRGEAKLVEGGYRVHGRFSFGSGCGHAGWIGAGTLVTKDGDVVAGPSGLPEMRVVFVPRDRVEFLGNWDVLGLSGTGSYDYEVPEQFVGEDWTFPLTAEVAQRGGPVYRLGVLVLTSIGHCGFALGVGRRSLEEIARVSGRKQRMGSAVPVRDQQLFQHDFAYHEAALRSARAYALELFGGAQASVEAGDDPTEEQRHRVRQATTYATRVAADVVRFAYTWAGTDALRPGPLQRCFRDIHAATQHIFVDNSTFTGAAPVLLATYDS